MMMTGQAHLLIVPVHSETFCSLFVLGACELCVSTVLNNHNRDDYKSFSLDNVQKQKDWDKDTWKVKRQREYLCSQEKVTLHNLSSRSWTVWYGEAPTQSNLSNGIESGPGAFCTKSSSLMRWICTLWSSCWEQCQCWCCFRSWLILMYRIVF